MTSGLDDCLSDRSALVAEIVRLGPWHINVRVGSDIETHMFQDALEGTFDEMCCGSTALFYDPYDDFTRLMRTVYPNGLEGRSVLDCACNCGAYLFWCKELGAGRCFGFDAREHWLAQAAFLAGNAQVNADETEFRLGRVEDLSSWDLPKFDVTLFNGIFYHLSDPIEGIKAAAAVTDELFVCNTAVVAGVPDGSLALMGDNPRHLTNGLDALVWYPTGPRVLSAILRWAGFEAVRTVAVLDGRDLSPPSEFGRVIVVAARNTATLAAYDRTRADVPSPVAGST